MRIIISPAKKMNSDQDSLPWRDLPAFLPQTEELLRTLQALSYDELKKLWKCNDQIAALNVVRLEHMDLRHRLTPAVLAYEGIQYQYMAPGVFTSQALDYIAEQIRPGISTEQINQWVEEKTREMGGIPAPLGFEGYPKSVCTSVNDVICHGIPRADQILHAGDILNVDCTTEYGGYIGDASRMFCIGTPSPEAAALVRVTGEAVERALSVLHPYCHLGDIGAEIASYVGRHGYTVVHEIGGHGVGLSMHEEPYVAHYGRAGHGMLLFPGMVFTIEPMVNAGSRRFIVDPVDGWTVRTADHSLSAQVEYMIEMTEEGPVVLSR